MRILGNLYVLGVAASLSLAGCSGRLERGGYAKGQVEGEVYYDGLPLASGQLHLRPFDYSSAEEVLEIRDGWFKGQVRAGKLHVQVSALKVVPNKRGPSGEAVYEQFIPPAVPLGPMIVDLKANDPGQVLEIDLLSKALPESVLIEDPEAYDKLVRQNQEHRKARAAEKKRNTTE